MSLNSYLVDTGFHELTLDLNTSSEFKLQSKKNVSADVLVHLIGKGNATLEITLEKFLKSVYSNTLENFLAIQNSFPFSSMRFICSKTAELLFPISMLFNFKVTLSFLQKY